MQAGFPAFGNGFSLEEGEVEQSVLLSEARFPSFAILQLLQTARVIKLQFYAFGKCVRLQWWMPLHLLWCPLPLKRRSQTIEGWDIQHFNRCPLQILQLHSLRIEFRVELRMI